MSSFTPGLYIVSTPIGNLDDITLRSIDILKKSEIILCEDTRRSLKLLNHFKIKKKLISYHKFNEKKQVDKIIQYLNKGKILSLISDAGTPLISDPGRLLVNECVRQDINVYPIPGPSSITAAMSISGFDDKFLFYGFLPKTEKEVEKVISSLNKINYSLVFFISGVKIDFYLKIFKKFFNSRDILIAREITKIHEYFYRSSIEKLKYFDSKLKGELTIVISNKYNKDNIIEVDDSKMIKKATRYLIKYSLKDTVELITTKYGISKNKAYKICLKAKTNANSS
tara:strand:+ start:1481 stop:2329 length:849 start_codon:yes stop_codon:yes gene_type:complete